MPPVQIRVKALLYQHFDTLTEAADAVGCTLSELSKCIRGEREYPHIRQQIAEITGKPVRNLFPAASSQTREKKTLERRAA